MFYRQRIVPGLSCRTDIASCRFVSPGTARRATRGRSVGRCHCLLVGWQRRGTTTESTAFPAIWALGRQRPRLSGSIRAVGSCRTRRAEPTVLPPIVAVLLTLRVNDALSVQGTFLLNDAL